MVAGDDELSLVEHLEELRHRIIVSLAAFGVALALCFWQNHLLLEVASAALPAGHRKLTTFGVTEPFTTTFTVAAYGAAVLALPVLVYEVYAYVVPAFGTAQRRTVTRLVVLAPLLFLCGVAFAYFLVLPAALHFLLGFNSDAFDVQVRAGSYYGFFGMTMVAGGIVFELPLAIVTAVRVGIVTVVQLRRNRRYAYLAIAVVAAALPGVDPVSMLLEMVPLLALFEVSLLLARWLGEPRDEGLASPPAAAEGGA